jgi:hypothetical protein
MGMTVVQATTYNPRLLKGRTKEYGKARQVYVWRHVDDLIYGLEWMLSTWIWKLEDNADPSDTEKFLDEMASADADEFESMWIDPIYEDNFQAMLTPVDWHTIWDKYGLKREEGPVPKSCKPVSKLVSYD